MVSLFSFDRTVNSSLFFVFTIWPNNFNRFQHGPTQDLVWQRMASLAADLNVRFLPPASFGLDYINPIPKGLK